MKRLFGRLICCLFGHPFNRVIQRPIRIVNGYGHTHKGRRPYCLRCGQDIGLPSKDKCWQYADQEVANEADS